MNSQEREQMYHELEHKHELLQSKYDGALELIASQKETISILKEKSRAIKK